MIVGGVLGLARGISNVVANNAAEAAAGNEAIAAADEMGRQTDAFAALSQRRREEMESQRLANDQEAGFQIGQATEQGRRAVGSATAGVGASGLRGGSKTSVLDQLQGDIDTQLGQMDVRRAEANRAATEAIGMQLQADTETIRQGDYQEELTRTEGEDLIEDSAFSWGDAFNILLDTGSGVMAGGNAAMNFDSGGSSSGTPNTITPNGSGYGNTTYHNNSNSMYGGGFKQF